MRFAGTIRGFNWKYAFGETLLIVIGVTIALAASSWYENRVDRQTEIAYIERLYAALASDVSRFSDFEKILDSKANTLKALLTRNADSLLSNGAGEFMKNIDYSEYKALPESNSATFEELISTGKLGLIRDAHLRDALAQYYLGFQLMSGILAEPGGNYRELKRSILPGEAVYDWLVDGKPIETIDLRSGLEELYSHPEFVVAANSELAYTADMMIYLRQYKIRAQELQSALEGAL
jgi:hypothetical protein